ncbi:hypothetical protein AeNC1_007218 [Aphanomyces euteiches]|nr:hypothetical protein AeNC1_007218 [Aphanomyces euteiches]
MPEPNAPQAIETMLFSAEMNIAHDTTPSKRLSSSPPWRFACKSPPIVYTISISFGFLSTWVVNRSYSKLGTFRDQLQAILPTSSCTHVSPSLISLLELGFPRRSLWFYTRRHAATMRLMALQTFVESLLNLHAGCMIECASSNTFCPIAQHIQAFFVIDAMILYGYVMTVPVLHTDDTLTTTD